MSVQNDIDRFHLVMDAIKLVPALQNKGAAIVQEMKNKLVEHSQYIREYGVDLPEVANWKWKQ